MAQNNIPNTVEEQLAALDRLGGLDALGTPKTDNMYHAGWAWAVHRFTTPSWWQAISAAPATRWQSPGRGASARTTRCAASSITSTTSHRTIYEVLDVPHPDVVNGHQQQPMDGVSLAYTFDHPDEPTRKTVQYFENAASRGIYSDGWFACAFGPFVPWDTPSTAQRLANWDANTEPWELYHLAEDFSQAHDLATAHPDKLEELKALFKEVSQDNLGWPIGAGLWLRIHPEDRIASPYTKWHFDETTTRMPEFTAPGLGGTQAARIPLAGEGRPMSLRSDVFCGVATPKRPSSCTSHVADPRCVRAHQDSRPLRPAGHRGTRMDRRGPGSMPACRRAGS